MARPCWPTRKKWGTDRAFAPPRLYSAGATAPPVWTGRRPRRGCRIPHSAPSARSRWASGARRAVLGAILPPGATQGAGSQVRRLSTNTKPWARGIFWPSWTPGWMRMTVRSGLWSASSAKASCTVRTWPPPSAATTTVRSAANAGDGSGAQAPSDAMRAFMGPFRVDGRKVARCTGPALARPVHANMRRPPWRIGGASAAHRRPVKASRC